ncbi:hypothetical protein JB92DRAFT_2896191 [Gautieria morchelliformis]|nr:hypothetical protein JB92DRAFT_2896191 [Gautieria morchelliformis]
MAESRKRSSRSVSGDLDSDGEFPDEMEGGSGQAPGKPGRKKNPNSQAARRDQNRIAQREFRLRKQQRIRDLEARVEILSGSKDETYVQMRDIIRELVAENQTLRNMVRGLSGFIGDGAGGALPSMGWTLKEFEAFINKAETDTAFEAFAKRKRAVQDGMVPPSSTAEKRSSTEELNTSRKRARTVSTNGTFDTATDVNFGSGVGNAFGSYNSDAPAMGLYSSMRPPPAFGATFLVGSDQQGSNSFMAPTSSSSGLGFQSPTTGTNGRDAFPSSYASGANTAPQPTASSSSMQSMPYMQQVSNGNNATPPQNSPASNNIEEGSLEDPKAQEARKLVGYHLDNYRRNSAYCLPPSLRPTLVQRTVEHEGIIDGIPHPELRNRMILLRGRFNLAECIHSYLGSTSIHGDDVLAHANWEIHEPWLKQYGYLVDATTLALTNRWRKERGAAEILLAEISPSEQLPGLAQG